MNEHIHNHSHILNVNKAFILGIGLNAIFVLVEFIAGIWSQSMGLLSDAGHNLSDIAGLLLAMLAFRLSKTVSTKKYTYGFKKSTVLVSLINAVILLITVGLIITESVEKFFTPQPIKGNIVAWVAFIGIIINALTALLFFKGKEKDLNIKGAYLHMLGDALISLGVVVSGIVIYFTDWYIIDSVVGLLVAVVIVISTWKLLRESISLSLDGVPTSIDIEKVTQLILSEQYVLEVHHLHIWALSTTQNALTAHIVVNDMTKMEQIKTTIKQKLLQNGIEHATLEFENKGNRCCNDCTHPEKI